MPVLKLIAPRRMVSWLVLSLLLAVEVVCARADIFLPTLKSGTVIYSNVTVYSQTEHDLYIKHDQGIGNIKISTLDDDSLRALGLKEDESDSKLSAGVSETMDKLKESLGEENVATLTDFSKKLVELQHVKLSPQIIGAVVGGTLLLYLFFCFCLKLICYNAGSPANALIWFPFLQLFPLLRAAKMPSWCFLLFLIPLVNVIVQIWWSFRIAKACGKSALVGLALILPVINLLAFLYLAFSKGSAEEAAEAEAKPMRFDGLANA